LKGWLAVTDGKSIALIPARGGSKGLPRKNVRLVGGKPLIVWTIEAAIQSSCFNRVVVSTEDTEIADIAKSYGAEAPFQRPMELAGDQAKSIEVVIQALQWFKEHGEVFDRIALLQPTSPLRNGSDIQNAWNLFKQKKSGAVVSVCECEHSPLWMNTIADDLSMADFLTPNIVNRNRQGLKQYYRLNGAIYLANIHYLTDCYGFFGPRTFAYIMPQERSVDIDSELDLKFAEFLLQNR
jgi:CMP-N,N'-diacetyllegionaminic acid synthase